MAARAVACVLVALAVGVPAAFARSPLKKADMKTITHDARSRAVSYANAYGARHWKVGCRKTSPYTARCLIRLIDIRAGTHDCTITTVYAVTRTHFIEGDVGRDGCA